MNNLKRLWITLLLALAMVVAYMPIATTTSYAAMLCVWIGTKYCLLLNATTSWATHRSSDMRTSRRNRSRTAPPFSVRRVGRSTTLPAGTRGARTSCATRTPAPHLSRPIPSARDNRLSRCGNRSSQTAYTSTLPGGRSCETTKQPTRRTCT